MPLSTLSQHVESYRFPDLVRLWARERLEHEDLVGRALARAVVRDGLRLQSADARWIKAENPGMDLRGNPWVGFCARPEAPLCVLRASALDHLLAIVQRAERPSPEKLAGEFVARDDFGAWCLASGLPLPVFWFPGEARGAAG